MIHARQFLIHARQFLFHPSFKKYSAKYEPTFLDRTHSHTRTHAPGQRIQSREHDEQINPWLARQPNQSAIKQTDSSIANQQDRRESILHKHTLRFCLAVLQDCSTSLLLSLIALSVLITSGASPYLHLKQLGRWKHLNLIFFVFGLKWTFACISLKQLT